MTRPMAHDEPSGATLRLLRAAAVAKLAVMGIYELPVGVAEASLDGVIFYA